MADRPPSIIVRNWERFQHYKKRNPPWIRLYRDLLDRPEYRALSDSAARLLVELWLLASEFEPGGTVPYDLMLLAWRTGRASMDASIDPSLQELERQGFISLPIRASADASANASTSTPQRQRTETEYREQHGLRPGVENSVSDDLAECYKRAEEDLLDCPESPPTKILTITGVAAHADRMLGLGRLSREQSQANLRIVRDWNGRGRSLEETMQVIDGLAQMVADRPGSVEWIKPGDPVTLKALFKSTLYDQGDGRAKRPLWDVAYEYAQRMSTPPPDAKRGGGPKPITIDLPRAS